MTKAEFLNRYNSTRTTEEALSKSISAAVQHNTLYNDVKLGDRKPIRDFWSSSLLLLLDRFNQEKWNENQYENEIIELKKLMNHEFRELINFRISHSQKSLSVFFKHMWCLGTHPIPPQCPVDRIILTRAQAPNNQRSWGFIDDIEMHRDRYALIRNASIADGYDNVSIWELENFQIR